jgi:hypothetical protein
MGERQLENHSHNGLAGLQRTATMQQSYMSMWQYLEERWELGFKVGHAAARFPSLFPCVIVLCESSRCRLLPVYLP